ncbi:MAG: helix-turn-helix domain-containing protein [Clostridia bacterium]|nr:helix-turn-helix domain-containing protein [Clostridia bacterium]
MNLSTNLRRLRLQCGLTQFALAEQLGVSDRAVSRWENGTSSPDITHLSQLAVLLHVSVDALLGVDDLQRQSAIEQALSACNDAMQQGDCFRAVGPLRRALAAYPNEPELMVCLARALLAQHTEEAAREALSLCRAANGKPARLSTTYGCKQTMALALHQLGKSEQAAQLVSDEMPSFWVCREFLYPRVAPPEKAEGQRQFNLLWLADHLFFTLRDIAKNTQDSAMAVTLLEKAVRIYREVTDGHAGLYEERICQAYLRIAGLYRAMGESSAEAAALEKARDAAEAYAAHDGSYHAPWLARVHDKPVSSHEADALRYHVQTRNE